MRLPGFTAEMSIYKSVEGYFLAFSTVDLTGVFTARLSHFNTDFNLRFFGGSLTGCCCPACYDWCDCCCAISGYVMKTPRRQSSSGLF